MGPGDYLASGLTPPARWLNQTSEPYYLWNNTNNGNPQGGIGTTPDVNEGVSFINNDTPMPGYTPYAYPHPFCERGLPTMREDDGRDATKKSL